MQSLKSMNNSNMHNLTKKAIRYKLTDGLTDPNSKKDSLLKIFYKN